MKILSLIFTALLLMASMACQPQPAALTDAQKAEIEKEVKARIDFWIQVCDQVDIDQDITVHPLDVHAGDNGVLYMNRDEIEKVYRPLFAGLRRQDTKPDHISIRVLARDIAVHEESGTFTTTDTAGVVSDPIIYVLTAVWLKQNGQWVVPQYHQSFLPKK